MAEEFIGDEGATAVEEQEWRSMGTFAPVQTLKMHCTDLINVYGIIEEDGTVHEVSEIYCNTPTSVGVGTSGNFQTVGRLRIHEGVAYIDLD